MYEHLERAPDGRLWASITWDPTAHPDKRWHASTRREEPRRLRAHAPTAMGAWERLRELAGEDLAPFGPLALEHVAHLCWRCGYVVTPRDDPHKRDAHPECVLAPRARPA